MRAIPVQAGDRPEAVMMERTEHEGTERVRIAVAGGTGLTGGHVVEIARRRGHEVVSLSRREGVDLVSGAGLHEALAGADTVIDVSNVDSTRTDVSVSFFAGATRNLLAAEAGPASPTTSR